MHKQTISVARYIRSNGKPFGGHPAGWIVFTSSYPKRRADIFKTLAQAKEFAKSKLDSQPMDVHGVRDSISIDWTHGDMSLRDELGHYDFTDHRA